MRQPLGVEVADHHHRGAEQPARSGRREPHRSGARDVADRAHPDAGLDRAVEAGRQNVAQHGEIADLAHGAIAIGELQQVEIGIGHHDVARLAADPAAHVDVAVGAARPGMVHVQADAGVAILAGAAATASDVERHGDEVANVHHFDVGALFDHLAGDLVAEHESRGRRGAAAHHVLIGAADVGGDHLQDDRMLDLLAVGILHLGVVDVLHLDLAGAEINDAAIPGHERFSLVLLCAGVSAHHGIRLYRERRVVRTARRLPREDGTFPSPLRRGVKVGSLGPERILSRRACHRPFNPHPLPLSTRERGVGAGNFRPSRVNLWPGGRGTSYRFFPGTHSTSVAPLSLTQRAATKKKSDRRLT